MEIRYNNKNRKINMKKRIRINVSSSYQIRTKTQIAEVQIGIAICDDKLRNENTRIN